MKLRAENIVMAYEKHLVIDDISFTLIPGTITALVGRNGSGKTTILKILSQIIDPQSGRVLIDDKPLDKAPEMKINYAFLPDRFDFFSYDTGEKAMEYYKIIYPDFDSDFVKTEADKIGLSLKNSIRTLSKGNKAILGLLIILATNAKFLFVDEVLDGLDVLNREKIMSYLIDAAAQDRSLLVSSHQIQELQGIAEKVLYLNMDGKISEFNDKRESSILKFQVVTKNKLPVEIAQKAVIRQHIGRVYTIIVQGEVREWEGILSAEEIVQFDLLPVLLGDLFYWEQGEVKTNERI